MIIDDFTRLLSLLKQNHTTIDEISRLLAAMYDKNITINDIAAITAGLYEEYLTLEEMAELLAGLRRHRFTLEELAFVLGALLQSPQRVVVDPGDGMRQSGGPASHSMCAGEPQAESSVTFQEAARLLGVTTRKIARMVQAGELHARRSTLDKRAKLIRREELERVLSAS